MDRGEIWQEYSSLKYSSIEEVGFLISWPWRHFTPNCAATWWCTHSVFPTSMQQHLSVLDVCL